MLTVGKHTMTIRESRLAELAGKEVMKLDGNVETGEEIQVVIWLTEKAMGIARAQLRLCGFDIDSRDLSDLHEEQFLLAGKQVPVLAEEYNGNIRCQIMLNQEPTKKRMREITAQLRAAKRDGESVLAPPATAGAPAAGAPPADSPNDGNDLPF